MACQLVVEWVERNERLLKNPVTVLDQLFSNKSLIAALTSNYAHKRHNAKGIQAVEHEIGIRC